jgi:heat shock protein HtpX
MKRIVLFLGTNFAVMLVLAFILNILGFNQPGSNWMGFVIMAGLMGMGGAFVSLLMSKSMAKRSTGSRVIETPGNETESWLLNTVRTQASQAGIGMPEVAIFQSPAPNAFATGANKNKALVAVSTGLLEHMNKNEAEAVLGHEVSHVANGDMVTLCLIQGVVNTFVLVFARIIATMVDRPSNDGYYRRGMGYQATYMIAQTVLGFLATMIVMWFSRWREFHADIGGANLSTKQSMISALERLKEVSRPSQLPGQFAVFGIIDKVPRGLKKLFMSHPPLEERIVALQSVELVTGN